MKGGGCRMQALQNIAVWSCNEGLDEFGAPADEVRLTYQDFLAAVNKYAQ